jgi:hypothetical protein
LFAFLASEVSLMEGKRLPMLNKASSIFKRRDTFVKELFKNKLVVKVIHQPVAV